MNTKIVIFKAWKRNIYAIYNGKVVSSSLTGVGSFLQLISDFLFNCIFEALWKRYMYFLFLTTIRGDVWILAIMTKNLYLIF